MIGVVKDDEMIFVIGGRWIGVVFNSVMLLGSRLFLLFLVMIINCFIVFFWLSISCLCVLKVFLMLIV